jgi:hypothetical protein
VIAGSAIAPFAPNSRQRLADTRTELTASHAATLSRLTDAGRIVVAGLPQRLRRLGVGRRYVPPTGSQLAGFEAFVRAVVERYAPGSPFWVGGDTSLPGSRHVWIATEATFGPTRRRRPTPLLSEIAASMIGVDPGAAIVASGSTSYRD